MVSGSNVVSRPSLPKVPFGPWKKEKNVDCYISRVQQPCTEWPVWTEPHTLKATFGANTLAKSLCICKPQTAMWYRMYMQLYVCVDVPVHGLFNMHTCIVLLILLWAWFTNIVEVIVDTCMVQRAYKSCIIIMVSIITTRHYHIDQVRAYFYSMKDTPSPVFFLPRQDGFSAQFTQCSYAPAYLLLCNPGDKQEHA